MVKKLFVKKVIEAAQPDLEGKGLRKHLRAIDLTSIGIGAIIGAGIFVITGQAAAEYAGPAVVISFLIASIICTLAGVCFAELSSLIPASGGSYAYTYVALGELPAWLVGWAVSSLYLASASTVSVGFSAYFTSLLADFGLHIPALLSQTPLDYSAAHGWTWTGSYLNLPAVLLVGLLGVLISRGIQGAAKLNHIMVVIKLSVIVLFVLVGVFFIQKSNWVPFIPENTGHFGDFGWSGILRASGLVFFAYLGFDTVSTLAQDAKDPQNDLPKGILGSLGVSTLAYIIVSLVLTGIASYTLLGVADPIAVALRVMGPNYLWLSLIVKLAILAGLSSVVLVQMLGQSRVFMAMGQDGLLPSIFRKVDARYQTPRASSWITVTICMALAAVFPVEISGQLVSMSALFVYAMICFAVLQLRQTHPEYKRPFKVPGVPFVPLLGAAACFGQMAFLPLVTWAQMGVWLVIGLFVYFSYGVRNSVLRKR